MADTLKGRRIVVTGAAGDIGRATLPLLLETGARLHLVDVDGDRLGETRRALGGGRRVSTMVSAMNNPKAVAKALDGAGGPLYALVHLAGILIPDQRRPKDRAVWDKVIAANLTTTYDAAVAFIPRADPKGPARMIFMSSVAAIWGSTYSIPYSAAKAGVFGLVRALAPAVAPGILVNALAPGIIDSRMPAKRIAEDGPMLRRLIPLDRFGSTTEVGQVIRFLCSPAADYITGQTISVDGGLIRR